MRQDLYKPGQKLYLIIYIWGIFPTKAVRIILDFIIIDLESTGLDPANDEIIEIGAVKIIDDAIVATFQTLAKAKQPLPDEIADLTGITNAMLADAPSLAEALIGLQNFAGNISYWVAHNITFESAFLNPLLERQPLWLDTIDLAKILWPQNRYFRLGYLLEQCDIKHAELHRALADAQGTAELLLLMLSKLAELPDRTWKEFLQIVCYVNSPLADLMRELFNQRVGHNMIMTDNAIARLDSTAFGASLDEAEINQAYQLPTEQIEDFFLALPDDKFEVRTEQITMSQQVARAFNDGKILLSEAGTGTGKSLAYLLPSVLYSLGSHQQVIISTNTINLQEQLLNKDIPLLQQELQASKGIVFQSAVLKGRSNYLCLRKWQQAKETATAETLALYLRLTHWLTLTASGDYSQLNLWGNELELLQRLSAASESCLNFSCRFNRSACFVAKARRKAQQANLLIINHSLLLSSASLVGESGSILPAARLLIIDEAHQLPQVAERQFSRRFSALGIRHVLNQFWQHCKPQEMLQSMKKLASTDTITIKLSKIIKTYEEIFPACQTFEQATKQFFQSYPLVPRQIRLLAQRYDADIWQPLEDSLSELVFDLKQFITALNELLYELGGDDDPYFSPDMVAALQSASTQITELQQTAQLILEGKTVQDDASYVIWLEKSTIWEYGHSNDILNWWVAPEDIRPLLNRCVYSGKQSIVFTSATLANNDFSYFCNELGLKEQELPICECLLPSPFDYQKNALLLLAKDIDDYTKSDELLIEEQLACAISKLVVAANGRTLVLFTSYQQLNGVQPLLRSKLKDSGIKLLAHGISGGRSFILESMQQNPRCCVLGVNSFWEGVDVKGDNLSLLIIVRLPFAPPNTPLLEAKFERIKEQGGNPFRDYSLPQAIIRFKQGFGRLIRSYNDRGVCCVLDQRIWHQKSYGKNFLAALPDMTTKCCSIAEMVTEIKKFLADN